ncbi:hypothetical protein [Reichenbachiella sp. MALMAid0571]|uniref:hypothetical protein n=1 Tax=Reichenbachiella sp. MALMAid0571 TaxID=3143939 RepID=UPI0032DFAB47
MAEKKANLFDVPLGLLFSEVKKHFPNHHYNFKKHVVVIEDGEQNTLGYIRLPLHLSLDESLTVTNDEALVLYLSIESGSAAICVMKGKNNIYHTTFSSYMTRKKQGFSQVKYLNKKGKSRAGSRVRLASTIDFFENINTTLGELFEEYVVDRIGLHCSTSLIPYLYQSKVACPFDKKDDRLYKIPVHLPQSNFTNLNGAIKKLMAPMLFYDEKNENLLDVLIPD